MRSTACARLTLQLLLYRCVTMSIPLMMSWLLRDPSSHRHYSAHFRRDFFTFVTFFTRLVVDDSHPSNNKKKRGVEARFRYSDGASCFVVGRMVTS